MCNRSTLCFMAFSGKCDAPVSDGCCQSSGFSHHFESRCGRGSDQSRNISSSPWRDGLPSDPGSADSDVNELLCEHYPSLVASVATHVPEGDFGHFLSFLSEDRGKPLFPPL